MVLWFVRAMFLLAILSLAFFAATSDKFWGGGKAQWKSGDQPQRVVSNDDQGAGSPDESRPKGENTPRWKAGDDRLIFLMILIPLVLGLVVVALDVFWRRKSLQAISGLFFGLLAGLAIAAVLGLVVSLVASIFKAEDSPITQMVRVFIGAVTVFVCITFVLQTKDDFRFIIPYVEFTRQAKGPHPILLDTSVIIDGRIADVAETRFLEGKLLVPRFVLAELQAVADSSDRLRRNRGRRGLDVLNKLQKSQKVDLSIADSSSAAVEAAPNVDLKLIAMAGQISARIMTNDYNLAKVAQLRGVDVLNINDLANSLRSVVLAGEPLMVRIVKPGEEPAQGIGYLEDGTMVVVDQGRALIGSDARIVVTSTLQTSAGRMVFGKVEEADSRAVVREGKA